MKKSDELRVKTRKLLAKNLIILVTLAVVAFAGAFSWFTQNTRATAGGVHVKTQVNDKLEFYIMPPSSSDQYSAINSRLSDNAAWNSANPSATPKQTTWNEGQLTFDFSDQQLKFMEGLFLCETTSDGITFNIPKLMQYGDIAYVDTTQAFDAASANDEYMSFDLYFRSKSGYSIKLTHESSITPNTTYSSDTFSDPKDTKKDAAIGAVRMSVLNASNQRQLLWIPGPDVYYDSYNGGGTDVLYTGLTPAQYANKGAAYYNTSTSAIANRTGEGTNDHAYYDSSRDRQVILHSTAGMVAGSPLGADASDDKTILTLTQQSGDYYYGHVRINLWIEGEDAEARLNFIGGKFDVNLKFDFDTPASP